MVAPKLVFIKDLAEEATVMKSSYWIGLAAISSCALALAMPAAANDGCGRYDRYDDGDAAGGAVTGAVVGGAVAGPPGAVVGAVVGSSAGDDDRDGDAAGGAITGAVVGGAVGGPPGAVVGAVIGGAAGDDDDCGYRHDGYGYNDDYYGGYSNDRYDDDDNSGYRQGYSEGYEAGQMRQLNGMDRGYRAEGYYARRDDYHDATYDEERTRYHRRGYYRHYRASSCWDPCRAY